MTLILHADASSRILDLCKWISEGSITSIDPRMSLTRDLGFDSMKLMQFFVGIEEIYPGVVLEEWFMDHSSGGRDTIGSVIQYLARAKMPAAAE